MRLMSWLAVLVVFCGGAFAQVAQDSTATVAGTVTDAKTSQSIRGAQIIFTQISGGSSRQQTTSDAEGHFIISGLPAGKLSSFHSSTRLYTQDLRIHESTFFGSSDLREGRSASLRFNFCAEANGHHPRQGGECRWRSHGALRGASAASERQTKSAAGNVARADR